MNRQTFQEMYQECQEITGDTSAGTLILFKKWINKGKDKFNAVLGRYYTRQTRTTNAVATQQYYQMPEDCIRLNWITFDGNPLTVINSDDEWNQLNRVASSGTPAYFYVKSADEYGLYPTPASNISNGIMINFEASEKDMTKADYVTGTVAVTKGSQTVTGSGTTFDNSMVGRYFKLTDDEESYRISGVVSATSLTLENFYDGLTESGKNYRIGQSSQVPGEYHENFIDYALYRYNLKRENHASAKDYKMLFEEALVDARQRYAPKTSSRVIRATRNRFTYDTFRQNNQI